MIRETDIENYLCHQARGRLTALVYKTVAVGVVGFPDRALYWIGRRGHPQHCLVELKAPSVKRPEARQRVEHGRLREKGAQVFVVNSKAGVDALLEELATW